MQAKKRLLQEIELLNSHSILRVYDLVLSLKKQNKKSEKQTREIKTMVN
jgi:hypothetical protein